MAQFFWLTVYLCFNLQVDSEDEDLTQFRGINDCSQNNHNIEMYFYSREMIKATTELFQTNAAEVHSIELPATLLIMHSAGSAVNISACD